MQKKELLKGNPFQSFISLPQSIRFFLFVQKKFGRCLSIKSWFQRFFADRSYCHAQKSLSLFLCVTSFSLFIEMTFAHSRCWAHVIHSSFLFFFFALWAKRNRKGRNRYIMEYQKSFWRRVHCLLPRRNNQTTCCHDLTSAEILLYGVMNEKPRKFTSEGRTMIWRLTHRKRKDRQNKG